MAPAGPPADPPDRPNRPDEPRDRDVADWDWGDDWDAGPAPRRAAAGDARRPDRDDDDRDAGPGPATAGDARDPTGRPAAGRDDRPAPVAGAGSGPDGDGEPPGPGRQAARASAPDSDRGALEADDAASDPAPESPARRAGRPAPRPTVVVRRRATAIGAAALLLVVLVVVVSAVAGGEDGDDGPTAASSRADGDRLRELTGTAARASVDLLEREAAVERYARIGRPIYCGAGRRPWVALTFDDGPGPLSAKWIAMMAKAGVPMTLFRIGRNIPGNEEYVRVQRNLGWDSGSHSQNHPALATLSAKDQRREIEDGDVASRRVLGRPARLFRPPYESHDAATDRIVEAEGMVQVLWNVDTQDSLGATSADEIVASARKGMSPGSIILMHEVKPNTLAAMPRIIAALRERGLTPVTVSRMLAGDGPSEAQLREGYDGCRVDVTPGRASS